VRGDDVSVPIEMVTNIESVKVLMRHERDVEGMRVDEDVVVVRWPPTV